MSMNIDFVHCTVGSVDVSSEPILITLRVIANFFLTMALKCDYRLCWDVPTFGQKHPDWDVPLETPKPTKPTIEW